MIGIDTNILARYYIEDRNDEEASHQRIVARRLIESGRALMVSKTVILEFEWVMRGYYGFTANQVISVLQHLLYLPQVTIEDRSAVEHAISYCEAGIALADALHHASYRECESMATFDDRKFARRAKKLRLSPTVMVLK
jgi:predicted nucleic-acid-binding protein